MAIRQRAYKSLKDELVKKSREAMLAAVQVYNNPQITFKSETFITLAVISWTYLLHAYYRQNKIEYRYFSIVGRKKIFNRTKNGAYKYWELDQCLNCEHCPVDTETVLNLKFLIGIRHEIEHQMTNRIDDYISAKLQACCINYAHYLCKLFGDKYDIREQLALSLQFAPVSPETVELIKDNPKLSSNVRNYIAAFESNLSENQVASQRYAYRLLFAPKSANRPGQADRVIEYIPADSPAAVGLNHEYTLIKETEKDKYLPSDIVTLMQDEGHYWFTISQHTKLWQKYDAKNPSKKYGILIAGKQWYWYKNWVEVVRTYCIKHTEDYKRGLERVSNLQK